MPELEYYSLGVDPKKFRPAFESQEAFEQYRIDFANSVKPDLEKYRIARIRSIEDSMLHIVG